MHIILRNAKEYVIPYKIDCCLYNTNGKNKQFWRIATVRWGVCHNPHETIGIPMPGEEFFP